MTSHKRPQQQKFGRIARRRLLELGAGAATLGSLGLASTPAHAQAPIDLVFSFGPDDSGTLQPLIDAFNAANEGRIRVHWRTMARESNDYFRQMLSDFQVGAADVDVIGADVIWTAEFAANDWILDLSSRFHDAYDPDQFMPAAMNSVVYGFEVWGVPWYTDAGMLFYRRDLLEASGFSEPPRTFDQLIEMSNKVMADAGLPHGYVFQGAEYEGGVTNALEFIWNAGGRVLTGSELFMPPPAMPVVEPNVVVVDNPDAAAGLAMARRLVQEGVTPEEVVTYREQEAWQTFLAGDAVFMRNWPYVYGVLSDPEQSKITPEQVGIAPLPVTGSATRSYSCLGGWNLMISAQSPHPDAAFEFIQYLVSPDAQQHRARDGGFLPTLTNLYEDSELLNEVPVLTLGRDAVRNARARPQSPLYSAIAPRIARAFTRVLTGQSTGQEAVEALERELRSLIRRYG